MIAAANRAMLDVPGLGVATAAACHQTPRGHTAPVGAATGPAVSAGSRVPLPHECCWVAGARNGE